MEEQQSAPAEQVKPPSLTDKIAGVFASPGELYEQVRLAPPAASNWLVPTVLLIIVTIVCSYLVMNNPSLQHQIAVAQQEAFDRLVQEGRITQAQADQQAQYTQPGSPMMLIGVYVVSPIFTFIMLFLSALVFWLIGRFSMKSAAPYMKVVEVIGLTFYIATLGRIVSTAMMFGMDSIHASPSLALVLSEFDPMNKVHQALSSLNVFTIWSIAVTAIGLARLFQRDTLKVLVLVFALSILLGVVLILVGIPVG